MDDKNKNKLPITPTPQLQGQQPPEQPRTVDHVMEAKKWAERYEVAKSNQLPMFKKWAKWYDDMYGHIHDKRMAPWRSKVYMPIIASKVWDLISRFIQYRPGWDVDIRSLPINVFSKEEFDKYMKEMNEKVEKIKMKLDYDYDNPLMDEPIQDELLGVMLDAAVTGQGVGRVPYCNKTTEYRSYTKQGENLNFTQVENKKATEGFNTFTGINIFNLFIAPSAAGLQKSPWVIIHDYKPMFELQRDGKFKKEDLAKLKTTGISDEFAQFNAARNRLVTQQDTKILDGSTALTETFECWDKETNECIIYGLGTGEQGEMWVELYRSYNIYWHQKYPLVPFYIRRKPYQFWGESLFENSETLQSAINDIFNHFMDSYNMADGMVAIEEGSYIEPYVVEPGGELRYRGEMPKQFKFPQPDAAGMQTAMNLVTGSIENATISQYASGIPNSATDNTQGTATGVTRMMEAAAEKVGFMRSNFRRSWREVGQMWLSNSQQFMRSDVVHKKKKNGETTYEVISPKDMLGIWGVKVDDGSFEPISKDEKRKNFLEFTTNLSAWAEASVAQAERTGDPNDALRLDYHDIAQRGAEHYGENASHFTLPTKVPPKPKEPEQPPAQPAAPAVPMMPPQMPMSAEEALGADVLQADGKSLPDTFPVRSAQSPALVG